MPVAGVGGRLRVGPQVNKFQQVSNNDHQMSVAGGRPAGLMSGGGEGRQGIGTQV